MPEEGGDAGSAPGNGGDSQQVSVVAAPTAPRFVETDQGRRFFGEGVRDELVRSALALLFAAIFLLTIVLSYLHLKGATWTHAKDWLQLLLPAETALIGSATGFYFGQRRKDSK